MGTRQTIHGTSSNQFSVRGNRRDVERDLRRQADLCDGRGVLLSVVMATATCHEKTLALQTIDEMVASRPEKCVYRLHHICLGKGYDYKDVIEGIVERALILHLKKRGINEEATIANGKKHPARRWVVERTNAWYDKFRRVRVRRERKFENYLAMVDLASTLITFRAVATA